MPIAPDIGKDLEGYRHQSATENSLSQPIYMLTKSDGRVRGHEVQMPYGHEVQMPYRHEVQMPLRQGVQTLSETVRYPIESLNNNEVINEPLIEWENQR